MAQHMPSHQGLCYLPACRLFRLKFLLVYKGADHFILLCVCVWWWGLFFFLFFFVLEQHFISPAIKLEFFFFFFFFPQPGSKNFFFRTKLEQFFVFYFQMSACEFYVSLTAMSYGDGDLGLKSNMKD